MTVLHANDAIVDQAVSASSWTSVAALAIVLLGVPLVGAYVQKINKSLDALKDATKTNRQSEGSIGLSVDQVHDKLDTIQEQVDALAPLTGQVRRVEKQQRDEHGVISKLADKLEENTTETRKVGARVTALELHAADRVVVDAVSFAELGAKVDRIGQEPGGSH